MLFKTLSRLFKKPTPEPSVQVESKPELSAVSDEELRALMQQARTMAQQGQFPQVMVLFEQAQRQHPHSAPLAHAVGDFWLEGGQWDATISHYQKRFQSQSDDATASLGLGIAWRGKGDAVTALLYLDKTLAIEPDRAMAHICRAIVLLDLGRLEEALLASQAAMRLDGDSEAVCGNQGWIYQKMGRYDEALACYAKALAINPESHLALLNSGTVHVQRLELAQARHCYETVLSLDDNNARAHFYISQIDLLRGDWDAGWTGFEWRWKTGVMAPRQYNRPLWLGQESIDGKTLFVYAEQGLGDTIQMLRFIPMLAARGAKVLLQVQDPALGLAKQMAGVAQWIPLDAQPTDFDLHSPMMSLPLALGLGLDAIGVTLPYLRAQPEECVQWQKRLGQKKRPRVGVVWSGDSRHENDHNRSIAFDEFAQLLGDGIEWVSLQKEIRLAHAAAVRACTHLHVHGENIQSFEDTAALIEQMDLVISVDTSVAHLAAAMGKPTWILLPYSPDWRWLLGRSDSPWYPGCVKLYRQGVDRQWAPVMERVYADLAD